MKLRSAALIIFMEQRLQVILAHHGIASRRKAAELIEKGKVKIDGRLVTEKGFRVDPEKHEIVVGTERLGRKEEYHYFLFNKPQNVISTAKDTHRRKKVTDFFKDIPARVYPVGRLDKDTTGLLIVTNDGNLAHKLMHPSFEIEKEYIAEVKSCLTKEDLKKLKAGIKIDGKKTSPSSIKLSKESLPAPSESKSVMYSIKLHEGRKRQIRRMFDSCGIKVQALKRVKYAGLILGKLEEGKFRRLTKKEVEKLKTG